MDNRWLAEIPPVTRTYVLGAVATTAACYLEIVSPFNLYFNAHQVIYKLELWRIFTNFFYFGSSFSLDFIFHMFFLTRSCRALEEGSFQARRGDFIYMILLASFAMLLIAPLFQMQFLGSSLSFMMVYVWARRNPHARMNFHGLFDFTAPYLPWVLLSVSVLFGSDGMTDFLGIVVGHLYYFCEDIYPQMLPSRFRLLRTPNWFTRLVGGDVAEGDEAVRFEVEPPPPALQEEEEWE